MWYYIFNDIFWLSVTPMVLGAGALCIRYAYRSKCSNVRVCWGLLEIQRDVEQEAEFDNKAGTADTASGTNATGASASSRN